MRDLLTRPRARLVSSAIAAVEVPRAARRHSAEARGVELLDKLVQIELQPAILEFAAAADPLSLSSLDALHLASALSIRDVLAHFVAYDDRLTEAARQAGLEVLSPS